MKNQKDAKQIEINQLSQRGYATSQMEKLISERNTLSSSWDTLPVSDRAVLSNWGINY